jgi:hypothetical protein
MSVKKEAVKLQNELLEKGFRSIERCDDHDDYMVTITHYSLSKSDKPSENTELCFLYKWFDLGSEEAVEILEKWMDQSTIYPDPRSL